MQDLKIKETFSAVKIDWQNCINMKCEFINNCMKIRPVECIKCKVFKVNPITIFRTEFIKNNSGEWIKIK